MANNDLGAKTRFKTQNDPNKEDANQPTTFLSSAAFFLMHPSYG